MSFVGSVFHIFVHLCRCFDTDAFRAELKDVLRTAGIEGTPLLLYLEERHLEDDPGVAHDQSLAVLKP